MIHVSCFRLIFIMDSWILIVVVVIMPGVWSRNWEVIFEDQCALKGASSVFIKCRYDYPSLHFVTAVLWSKAQYTFGRQTVVPLSELPSPPDFRYLGNTYGNCDLKINNLRDIDEGVYVFSFWTSLGSWVNKAHVTVSVKELTTVVQPSSVTEGDMVSLSCVSGCTRRTTVVFYRDGQLVPAPVFQARKEDAGMYHCAANTQPTVRSKPVALNVQYAPKRVTLSMSPSGDIVQGSSVSFTCSSDANPPVTINGYSLFKDGQFMSSGQNHIISDILPGHSGLYLCQAWNNISWKGHEFINSTEIHLDVQYHPTNISVSMDPPQAAEGDSVNLTCSSVANPAAVNYTWYKRTDDPSTSTSTMLQVGSGQVLSLPSVETSHTGLYICWARNSVGESNSTKMLLIMKSRQLGIWLLPVLAGVGVFVFVALVIVLILFWRKHRTCTKEKETVLDSRLSGRGSSSSANENQPNTVYANIHTFQPNPPLVPAAAAGMASHSQRKSHHGHNFQTSYEAEVTYAAVTIKPRNQSLQHHMNSSTSTQDSKSGAGENRDSVIYTILAVSR